MKHFYYYHRDDNWIPKNYNTPSPEQLAEEAKELSIHPLLLQHLYSQQNRNQEEVRKFLNPDWDDFSPIFIEPFFLTVVSRLVCAIGDREKIAIIGSPSTLGLMGTTMLHRVLATFTDHIFSRLATEEYPMLTKSDIDYIPIDTSLLIVLDYHNNATEALLEAKRRRLELINMNNTELHPPLAAKESPYFGHNIIFTIFKLLQGLYKPVKGKNVWEAYPSFLNYAVIGMIAEGTILTNNNRIIAKHGLEALNHSPVDFFKRLKELMKIDYINSDTIRYQIIPFLDANLCYLDPNYVLDLLVQDSLDERTFDTLVECQSTQEQLIRDDVAYAQTLVDEEELLNDQLLVIYKDIFQPRHIEKIAFSLHKIYQRPVAILTWDGLGIIADEQNVTLKNPFAPKEVGMDWIKKKYKATLFKILDNEEFVEYFIKKLKRDFKSQQVQDSSVSYVEKIPISDIPLDLSQQLVRLEPFGRGNKKPLFLDESIKPKYLTTLDEKHLLLKLDTHSALLFDQTHLFQQLTYGNTFKCLYCPNHHDGQNIVIQHIASP